MTTQWKAKAGAGVRKLACIGYRSGTGTAVSIAISTRYWRPLWDFVPKDNSTWHHDRSISDYEKKKKSMQLLVGEDPDDDCVCCLLDAMDPRTCAQGTADWFVDRQLSGTSSTIAAIILSVAPTVGDSDPVLKEAFITALKHAGYDDVVGSAADAPEDTESSADDASSAATSNGEDDDMDGAKNWISTLQDSMVDMDNEFLAEMDGGEIDLDVLRWMVSLIKGVTEKSNAIRSTCKTTLKKWIKVDKQRHPYEFLPMTILKEKAMSVGIKASTKKKLIDKLIKPPDERQEPQQSTRPPKPSVPPTIAPLVTLFKQSFLCPQKNEGNQTAARIGHENEEPFLRSFYDECQKSNDDADDFNQCNFDLPIKAICRVGLMRKRGSRFAKASLDGVAFLEDDEGLALVPVEVKSRVSSTTMTEAQDRIKEEVGTELHDERRKYLLHLSSSDALL